MEKIKAAIRIRPCSGESVWRVLGEASLVQEPGGFPVHFDRVFDHTANTGEVFSFVREALSECLSGVNGCILAYGQTSSGKTHTMKGVIEGKRAEYGVIPRAILYFFERAREIEMSMNLSFVEVYNEVLTDLLSPGNVLKIHESSGETYVKGAEEVEVGSAGEALEVFMKGDENRKIGTTQMNRKSSRSHSVFIMKIKTKRGGRVCRSFLSMVDLAGSERARMTGAEGQRLKEGGSINKSLLALTTVITKLSTGEAHIPYRDSKLTRILQPTLSGNSKTVLICTISPRPEFVEESISTLNLAARARGIVIAPLANKQSGLEGKEWSVRETEIASEVGRARDELVRMEAAVESVIRRVVECPLLNVLLSVLDGAEKRVGEIADRSEILKEEALLLVERVRGVLRENEKEKERLVGHEASGDRVADSQKKTLEQVRNKAPRKSDIRMAVELARVKREFAKEKRLLELKIAKLEKERVRLRESK
jgi:centromeric protein E